MDLRGAANPDWAAAVLDQLDDTSLPQSDLGRHRLVVALGASRGLGELALADPTALAALDQAQLPDPTADVVAAAPAELRDAQRRGLFYIAVADLTGELDTHQAAGSLSDLADAVLVRAHREAADLSEAGDTTLAVLAMGKLGGQELNYVSDVDVIFVHDGDQQAAVRMAQRVLDVAGLCYEMDAALRPEGRSGVLSRTVDSHEAYHQRWGRTWELQALMKMRHAAGAAELSAALTDALRPLIWPDARGAEVVSDIQQMKGRVERSGPVRRHGSRQLKLAPGGLRDIEFAIQLLQLVHGPADARLRHRGTLPALHALAEGGYVDEGDAQLFGDAYRFLRTIEHRLQLWGLRRTHTLPDDADDVRRLAHILGFRDLTARSATTEFERELRRVRAGVRRLHEKLFFRPLLATVASWDPAQRLAAAPDGEVGAVETGLDRQGASLRLRALGFNAPGRALTDVEALISGTTRPAQQLRVALPVMLEALSHGPDPDGGLRALRDLADALAGRPAFLRLIRDNPYDAAFLARVLSHSPRLATWFARQPETLQLCTDREALRTAPPSDDRITAAVRVVERGGGTGGADALRRHKRRAVLRTALRAVAGDADARQIGHELSDLCEGVVASAVHVAAARQESDTRLGVVALGRFGASELGFASDLDVLFVHEGEASEAERQATAVVAFLDAVVPEGQSFAIDTRLRPEGRVGPLSRSVSSHLAYYQRWAKPWELFALTQARAVAGDTPLADAVLDGVADLVYQPSPDPDRLRAIRRMKARIEAERAGSGHRRLATGPGGDLKVGPGGLGDVEWTVQLLRMIHGHTTSDLRLTGTVNGIASLETAGLLGPEEARWLKEGWLLLSDIRNGLYLLGERQTDRLPVASATSTRLAALVGCDGQQDLQEQVARACRRIRRVFDSRFFD